VRHDSSMSTPDKGSPKVKGKSPLINVKTSAPKIYLHIGSKSTNYGVVSYRSENIYLRGERGNGTDGTERAKLTHSFQLSPCRRCVSRHSRAVVILRLWCR
jgi:hypothetical protein